MYFDYKDESGFPKPPSYNVATTLPSYDEAERTKAEATIPLVPGRVSLVYRVIWCCAVGIEFFSLSILDLLLTIKLISKSTANFKKQVHFLLR